MSWRWTQWTLIFFAILSMAVTLFSRETYKAVILSRRTKQRNIALPPGPSALTKLSMFLTITLVRPLHMLFTEPIVASVSLYTGFNFSIIFGFMAAYPYVFRSIYDFGTIPSGLIFLAIGFGGSMAVPTVLLCDHYFYQPRVRESKAASKNGSIAPEYRLYPAMIGCFGLPTALFWFAWTARPSVSWWSPVIASIPFAWETRLSSSPQPRTCLILIKLAMGPVQWQLMLSSGTLLGLLYRFSPCKCTRD